MTQTGPASGGSSSETGLQKPAISSRRSEVGTPQPHFHFVVCCPALHSLPFSPCSLFLAQHLVVSYLISFKSKMRFHDILALWTAFAAVSHGLNILITVGAPRR